MFNIENLQNKNEIDFGWDDYNPRYSSKRETTKIKEVLVFNKKCNINFELLVDSIETLYYVDIGLFSYIVGEKELTVTFLYKDNELNKSKVEKIKNFLNKYEKKKIVTNQKIISL